MPSVGLGRCVWVLGGGWSGWLRTGSSISAHLGRRHDEKKSVPSGAVGACSIRSFCTGYRTDLRGRGARGDRSSSRQPPGTRGPRPVIRARRYARCRRCWRRWPVRSGRGSRVWTKDVRGISALLIYRGGRKMTEGCGRYARSSRTGRSLGCADQAAKRRLRSGLASMLSARSGEGIGSSGARPARWAG